MNKRTFKRKIILKVFHDPHAVSNVIGTILLLTISMALFASLILLVQQVTYQFESENGASFTAIGGIEEEKIIIEHRGGLTLPPDTKVEIQVASISYIQTIADLVDGEDDYWSAGELLTFDYSTIGSLIDLQVIVTIIDTNKNSILFDTYLQKGEQGNRPYVQTIQINGGVESATMKAHYNFINQEDDQCFIKILWREAGETDWQDPGFTDLDGYGGGFPEGDYTFFRDGLDPDTRYAYRAVIRFGAADPDDGDEDLGDILTFYTKDTTVGEWLFDETSGIYCYDETDYDNHGEIITDVHLGPQRFLIDGDNYGLHFDGIDGLVKVEDDVSLHLEEELTYEMRIRPGEYLGEKTIDFSDIENDIDLFGPVDFDCYEPDVVKVGSAGNDNFFAITCRNHEYDGYVVTVKVLDDGSIVQNTDPEQYNGNTVFVDYYRFEGTRCKTPKIMQVDDTNVYAIYYEGSSNTGKVVTIQISESGVITKDITSDLIFEETRCVDPEIFTITEEMYGVVYTSSNDYGKVATVSIRAGGVIEFKNSEEFPGTNDEKIGVTPHATRIVSTDYYVIVFNCVDNNAGILTFFVETNTGEIQWNDQEGEDYFILLDDLRGETPRISHVSSEIYLIVYGGQDPEGSEDFIANASTIRINQDGQVVSEGNKAKRLYSKLFDEDHPSSFTEPEIQVIDTSGEYVTYAIIYRSESQYSDPYSWVRYSGYITTLQVKKSNGEISLIDWINFQPAYGSIMNQCYTPDIAYIDSGVYLVVYRNRYDDGVLKTVAIPNDGQIFDADPSDDYPIQDTCALGIDKLLYNGILHVHGETFVIVYSTVHQGGRIRTIQIDEDGTILSTRNDTHDFEPGILARYDEDIPQWTDASVTNLQVLHVADDLYVIAYEKGESDHLKMQTFTVNEEGEINHGYSSVAKEFTFSHTVNYLDFTQIYGSIYACAYRGKNSNGYIHTFEITRDDIQELHTEAYQPSHYLPNFNQLISLQEPTITPTLCAVVYQDTSDSSEWDLVAKTLSIDDEGEITIISDSLFIIESIDEDSYASYIDGFLLQSDPTSALFAIAWRHPDRSDDGFISTVYVDLASQKIVDIRGEMRYDLYTAEQRLSHIRGRNYSIIFPNNGRDGFIKSFRISETGNITQSVDNIYPFESELTYQPSFCQLDNDTGIIVYAGHNHYDLSVKTCTITDVEGEYLFIQKNSEYGLSLSATKLSMVLHYEAEPFEFEVPLTDENNWFKDDWNHVAVTFDTSLTTGTIKVFINHATPVASFDIADPLPIPINGKELLFGPANVDCDFIRLSSKALSGGEMYP